MAQSKILRYSNNVLDTLNKCSKSEKVKCSNIYGIAHIIYGGRSDADSRNT